MRRLLGVLAVAVALLALPAVEADAAPNPRVLVYGDSLTAESKPFIAKLLRDVAGVEGQVVGLAGQALCDALPRMRQDAAKFRPTIVILSFGGNALTPCMKGPGGRNLTREEIFARYRQDTATAISIFRANSPAMWLTTSPQAFLQEKRGDNEQRRYAAMWNEMALQNRRVRVADAAASVLQRGLWTRTLHCLPKEPCQGGVDLSLNRINLIRSYDTGHFCPTTYTAGGDCATHSSGALRFAVGQLKPALQAQGLWNDARARNTMFAGWPGEAGR